MALRTLLTIDSSVPNSQQLLLPAQPSDQQQLDEPSAAYYQIAASNNSNY
jgi:hypothetical protein